MADDNALVSQYSVLRGLALTVTSAAFGLALFAITPRLSRKLALTPSQVDFSVTPLAWNAFNICLLARALRREGRYLTPQTVGLSPIRWRTPDWGSGSRWAAGLMMLGLMMLTASPIRRRTIDSVWSILPGPAWAVNSTPNTARGEFPLPITPTLAAFQLLIRNPFTVTVEEALFAGFLYPRLGRWAPLKMAVLSGVYHLPQWWTIPTIVPWAGAIGISRELSGNPWPGIGIHYAGNALFVLEGLASNRSQLGAQTDRKWFRSFRRA